MGLRERPLVRLGRALFLASPGVATVWAGLLVLRALLPTAFALASGWFVARLQAEASTLAPLLAVGSAFVALQVMPPVHNAVSQHLGALLAAHLSDRIARATTEPAGIGHLEDPEMAGDLTLAREFDAGISSVPMYLAIDFATGSFSTLLAGIACAIALVPYTWWGALVLLAVWAATHVLLRESGVWKDRNTAPVQAARRMSDYTFRMAVEPEHAKELRLFGVQDWTLERFIVARTDLYRLQYEATRLRERSLLLTTLVTVGGSLLVFWWLGERALSGALPVAAAVVAAQLAMGVSAIAFGGLNWALDDACAPVLATERLEPAMRSVGALTSLPGTDLPRARTGIALTLDDLHFTYPRTDRPIYAGLDLQIRAGESLAIVGANGAGKTTLAKLLCRFYDPTSGRILADGVDLRALDVDEWRSRITAVFQDVLRLELSLRDNVDPAHRASDAQVREALAAAGADALAGLDTPLSKAYAGGTDLSGGQWQRVALARALCSVRTGAQLVLLDEPTASLDVRGEMAVFRRLLEATDGATRILISHRFSTVRMADRIAVLDDGRVAELGTHDELMAAGGRYARMYTLQASRFDETDEEGVAYEHLG